MSQPDERGPVSVWRRWTDPEGVPFHRYCAFLPTLADLPLVGPTAKESVGADEQPTDDEAGDAVDDEEREGEPAAAEDARNEREPAFRFVRGPVRAGLRFTPLVVVIVGLAFVVVGELSASVVGLSENLPGIVPSPDPVMVVAAAVWVGLLLVPLHLVDVVPTRRILGAVGFYGLVGLLAAGSAFAVLLTAAPAQVPLLEPAAGSNPRAVLDGSGLLLLMLLGGMLVYDMLVRLENTLTQLPAKSPSVIEAPTAEGPDVIRYEDYLDEFRGALDARIELPAVAGRRYRPRVAYVFAGLFLLPFVLSRLFQFSGDRVGTLSLSPIDLTAAVLPTVLNVFLVVVFFQFLVALTYVHRLLTRHSPATAEDPTRFSLRYVPGHPDGYAGFRDFGRFATRVNTLLLLGGFYLAYRLYVLGVPALEALGPTPGTGALLNWSLLFVGPLLAYLLATLAWLYLSFWQVHRAMVRGREHRLRDALRDATPFDIGDVRSAPVWPVNSGLLLSMVSIDAMPLVTLLPLL